MRCTHSCTRALAIAGIVLASFATDARAQSNELFAAKHYFKAGAEAYEVGDYLAAIQALDAAYRLTPLPAIAFSLAQAERRQFVVSREREHLDRAIELFRAYLHEVTQGGRRADAIDALGQLEPLAVASAPQPSVVPPTEAAARVDKTRLMISCQIAGATISLDGAQARPAPLIAQVTPGSHRLRVEARGFLPSERNVEAIVGELVPIEISLREKAATLLLRSTPDAELFVDGTALGNAGAGRRLELPSGMHALSFVKNGYRLEMRHVRLAPGANERWVANLHPTHQRAAALALFIAGGAGLATSMVLSALAIDRESAASQIFDRRMTANISSNDRHQYSEAVQDRDRWRLAAVATLSGAVAALVTGLFLYALDEPNAKETLQRRPEAPDPQLRGSLSMLGAPGTLRVDVNAQF